jgi:hypothetical protein
MLRRTAATKPSVRPPLSRPAVSAPFDWEATPLPSARAQTRRSSGSASLRRARQAENSVDYQMHRPGDAASHSPRLSAEPLARWRVPYTGFLNPWVVPSFSRLAQARARRRLPAGRLSSIPDAGRKPPIARRSHPGRDSGSTLVACGAAYRPPQPSNDRLPGLARTSPSRRRRSTLSATAGHDESSRAVLAVPIRVPIRPLRQVTLLAKRLKSPRWPGGRVVMQRTANPAEAVCCVVRGGPG